jgi:hypothetical protein
MFQAFSNVVTAVDNWQGVQTALAELVKKDVLVGIPEAAGGRKKNDKINNAQLAYIHTHGIRRKAMREEMQEHMDAGKKYSEAYQMYIHSRGSPLWHAPPRPIIEPAIQHNKKALGDQYGAIIRAALSGGNYNNELKKLGMMGQNFVRDWFTNPANGWPPNSPITIKLKSKKGKGLKDKPLINTGELRKSITYVQREKGGA